MKDALTKDLLRFCDEYQILCADTYNPASIQSWATIDPPTQRRFAGGLTVAYQSGT